MKDKVHIFWDNSNIFIPAKYVANKRDRILPGCQMVQIGASWCTIAA